MTPNTTSATSSTTSSATRSDSGHPRPAIRRPGTFVISLDFELYWGVLESKSLQGYQQNLEGVPDAITAMLRLFKQHSLHVTWATVGLLYCQNRQDALQHLPNLQPSYTNDAVDPYRYLEQTQSLRPQFHFAKALIDVVAATPHQEIATHTFSHYFCQEPGQTKAEFIADLTQAVAMAEQQGHVLQSIVFPRNQINPEYHDALTPLGITNYRGVEDHWAYDPDPTTAKTRKTRLFRLIDSYINLSGFHTHALPTPEHQLVNLKSSRFLRPYSPKLRGLDWLKLRRIKRAMTHAAQHGEAFHLWWHPHNFGTHLQQNMQFLRSVAEHFRTLQDEYGMRSQNMSELAAEALSAGDATDLDKW